MLEKTGHPILHQNVNRSETNVSFNNKFQLNLLQLMFGLMYVAMNIQNILCLECRHAQHLRHWSMPSSTKTCSTPTRTSL